MHLYPQTACSFPESFSSCSGLRQCFTLAYSYITLTLGVGARIVLVHKDLCIHVVRCLLFPPQMDMYHKGDHGPKFQRLLIDIEHLDLGM